MTNIDTPYLLLVALSGGLPVSMGSGEFSSLDLLTERKGMVQTGNKLYAKYFNEQLMVSSPTRCDTGLLMLIFYKKVKVT